MPEDRLSFSKLRHHYVFLVLTIWKQVEQKMKLNVVIVSLWRECLMIVSLHIDSEKSSCHTQLRMITLADNPPNPNGDDSPHAEDSALHLWIWNKRLLVFLKIHSPRKLLQVIIKGKVKPLMN